MHGITEKLNRSCQLFKRSVFVIQGLANSFGFLRVHQGANFNLAIRPLGSGLLAG